MQSIEKLRKASNEKKQMSHDVSMFFSSNIFPSFLVHVIVNMAMMFYPILYLPHLFPSNPPGHRKGGAGGSTTQAFASFLLFEGQVQTSAGPGQLTSKKMMIQRTPGKFFGPFRKMIRQDADGIILMRSSCFFWVEDGIA